MTLFIRVALVALVAAQAVTAQAQDAAAQADRLYQQKDWAAAATAYAALATTAPRNPVYAFRQGSALLGLGRGTEAIAHFDAAAGLGFPKPLMQAWSARALARSGDLEGAVALLKTATTGGFAQVAMLDTQADFASLRADARFAALREAVDRNARPCAYGPEYRQLDFWVGDWNVTSSGAQAGESHVERMLGDCVVFENWTGGAGVTGKSFNIWDNTKHEWRQTWVDSTGTLTEFRGQLVNGNMLYEAESLLPGPDGALAKTRQKMTFFNQNGKVRQLGEASTDDGKTWSVGYDLLYTRKGDQ